MFRYTIFISKRWKSLLSSAWMIHHFSLYIIPLTSDFPWLGTEYRIVCLAVCVYHFVSHQSITHPKVYIAFHCIHIIIIIIIPSIRIRRKDCSIFHISHTYTTETKYIEKRRKFFIVGMINRYYCVNQVYHISFVRAEIFLLSCHCIFVVAVFLCLFLLQYFVIARCLCCSKLWLLWLCQERKHTCVVRRSIRFRLSRSVWIDKVGLLACTILLERMSHIHYLPDTTITTTCLLSE